MVPGGTGVIRVVHGKKADLGAHRVVPAGIFGMVTISIAIEHIITPFLVIFNVLFDLFSFGFAAVLFAVPAGVRVLHPQGS